jgi:hypothetical protein
MVPYDIRGCLEGLALLVWKSRMALAISPLEQEILVTSPTCPAIFGRHTRLKLFGPNFFSDVSERLFLLHGTVATTSLKRIFFTSVESHEACSRACLMGGARSRRREEPNRGGHVERRAAGGLRGRPCVLLGELYDGRVQPPAERETGEVLAVHWPRRSPHNTEPASTERATADKTRGRGNTERRSAGARRLAVWYACGQSQVETAWSTILNLPKPSKRNFLEMNCRPVFFSGFKPRRTIVRRVCASFRSFCVVSGARGNNFCRFTAPCPNY